VPDGNIAIDEIEINTAVMSCASRITDHSLADGMLTLTVEVVPGRSRPA
jgi:hypothetical protein